MGAIDRYKRKNELRKKRIYWIVFVVLVFALIAPYLWMDEIKNWVDTLGIEIVITKEIE